jgi:hypothetical protein
VIAVPDFQQLGHSHNFMFHSDAVLNLILRMTGIMDQESRKSVYRQLRQCSERVRATTIPTAVAESTPAGQVYFDMVKAYFEDDVRNGELVSPLDVAHSEKSDRLNSETDTALSALTRISTVRHCVAGFETLHPRYRQAAFGQVFAAVDSDRKRRRQDDLDVGFLAVLSFCMQLGHFPLDGNGRVGEDMLVLLAAEAGRNLTFSPTSYRGGLEGQSHLLLYRGIVEKIFFTEVTGNFFRFLGLQAPDPVPTENVAILTYLSQINTADRGQGERWPEEMEAAIIQNVGDMAQITDDEEVLFQSSHPYRYYAEFLAAEITFLTMCLESQGKYMHHVASRYPASFSCSLFNIISSLGRTWHSIPEEIADSCDTAVTLIEAVRYGQASRKNAELEQAVAKIETINPQIGQLFRRELSSCLTYEELSGIHFNYTPQLNGASLSKQIQACISKAGR